MKRHKFLIFMSMVLAVVALSWGIDQRAAQAVALIVDTNPNSPGFGYYIPDYYTTPNWANSPPLRKFVDRLPGLGPASANNLGQYIPVAVANTTAFPGSDYYEIELVEYRERMHSDLPAVVGGKTNPAATGGTKLRGYRQVNHPSGPQTPQYLGPLIIAQKDRPVRIKFTNSLPTGTGGNLFVPVDTTIMGSGPFEINYDPVNKIYPAGPPFPDPTLEQIGIFTQNRATIHLHGGRTPWISDGTPHQWITPAGETTYYSRGVSVENVPGMPDPGNGSQTFFWSNSQSARLMFYHDHAWGITRLNVYAGEAAGYLLTDPTEQALIGPGGALAGMGYGIPLVIQDKTFVDATLVPDPANPTGPQIPKILITDPTWAWGSNPQKPVTATPVTGDLWWPHVYMPAQNPFNPDLTGINQFGRYHYGPWFFPPTPVCGSSPEAVPPLCVSFGVVPNPYCQPTPPTPVDPDDFDCSDSPGQPPFMPGTPHPSTGAEAFLDTMLVNGTAYPYLEVQPQQYRFRILNAAHDRFLNLQLYQANTAVPPGCPTCAPNTEVRMIPAVPAEEGIFNNDWTPLSGATPSGPAMAWNPVALNLQMVVRGGGNSIWTATLNSSGAFNNDWTQVPGATLDSPALAWNPVTSEMQMVVRGGGDSIWTATFNSSGAFNNDWTQISGVTPDSPALAWNPVASEMQLVVRGGGNSIWTATFDSTGTFNNDWTQVPGATPSAPALAWNPEYPGGARMQMAVRGMDSLIYTATFNSSGVFNNDWTFIFGTAISSPALVSIPSGKMHMVVTMAGNSIWTGTFNPATGAFNYDWKQIPGAILDAPALAWNSVANTTQMVARGLGNSIWTATGGTWPVPATWPTDGREGGVPDFAMRGPAFIQIGTEGGFLPSPVVLPNQPVTWNMDPTMFNVGNVLNQADGGGTLFLGPAERADVIVDFTNFAGKTLILYNDAPTAFPALVPQYDYYTGAPDRRDIGGVETIPVGRGPNIRTVMQIRVAAGASTTAPPDDYNAATLTALQTAFNSAPGLPGVFGRGQAPIIVGQTPYNSTYNTTFPATFPNWGVSRISDDAISYQTVTVNPDGTFTFTPVSNFPMQRKAIHDEMGATFDDYGRMSAKLGLEVPFANAASQNFILQNYVDPPTEFVPNGQVQIWRITHNGVDTHPIHFHFFEVQLINRVGWDGFIRLPDPNELGWKDTVRISPLEDTIVALRATIPTAPFAIPNSIRPLNPSTPLGSTMGFSQIDITTGGNLAVLQTNQLYDFGYEYVWHCHILSHEENDMMRSIVISP
jgi:FtsP/CotA-like multicopper oxidase with cupredoxin domain